VKLKIFIGLFTLLKPKLKYFNFLGWKNGENFNSLYEKPEA